jgi:hypothetical protein
MISPRRVAIEVRRRRSRQDEERKISEERKEKEEKKKKRRSVRYAVPECATFRGEAANVHCKQYVSSYRAGINAAQHLSQLLSLIRHNYTNKQQCIVIPGCW